MKPPGYLHYLRRWLWGHFGGFFPNLQSRCVDCGAFLTAEERHYYEITCEKCKGINFHRLDKATTEATPPRASME